MKNFSAEKKIEQCGEKIRGVLYQMGESRKSSLRRYSLI